MGWVTVYDAPNRRISITAATELGHHWTPLTRMNPESDSYTLLGNDEQILYVELEIDHSGLPIAVPPGLNIGLMPSWTIWPHLRGDDVIGPDRQIWWSGDTDLFTDREWPDDYLSPDETERSGLPTRTTETNPT